MLTINLKYYERGTFQLSWFDFNLVDLFRETITNQHFQYLELYSDLGLRRVLKST